MKRLLTLISLFAFTLIGCAELEEPAVPIEAETEYIENNASVSKTRTSAPAPNPSEYTINPDNPYSLSNIQRASDLVMGANAPILEPTHHYVRFLPQDTTDMYILIDSLDLDIYPYPRDWMLTSDEREAYRNATINGFPWYYCLVEPDFQMPTEMESEFLDYAYVQPYITGSGPSLSSLTPHSAPSQLPPATFTEILDRSIAITGNISSNASGPPPMARITYVSDNPADTAPIPIKNVLVRANFLFGSAQSYTNANGEAYLTGLPSVEAHHLIIWKDNGNWRIRERKTWDKAKTEEDGRSSGTWELQISGNSKDAMWATISRALDAYYHDSYPKVSGLVKFNEGDDLDVWARYGEPGTGNFNGTRNTEIHICSNNEYTSAPLSNTDLLSTTFHELGHASHFQVVGRNYFNAEPRLRETWASGVEYAYLSSLYPNNYTPFVSYGGESTTVIESLMWQGLSLQQLQSVFMGKTQLGQCIQPIKDLSNIPDVLIDALFNFGPLHPPLRVNFANLSISGPSAPPIGVPVNYSIPTDFLAGTGIRFDGWYIEDGFTLPELSISGIRESSVEITFWKKITKNLLATFVFPGGQEYTFSKTVTSSLSNLAISGPDSVAPNTNVTYSVAAPPSGITFNGWNIIPSTYTTTGGTTDRNLNIQFTAVGQYTLTANYTLPRDLPLSVTKTVEVVALSIPTVTYELINFSPYLGGSQLSGQPSGPIPLTPAYAFSVVNPQQYCDYEWKINGTVHPNSMTSINIDIPQQSKGTTVSCRARYGNEVSAWGTNYIVSQNGVQEAPTIIGPLEPVGP